MTDKPDNEDTILPPTDNRPTDNRQPFNPLGKYAVVAVIMVSIIVITAVMLDRQLNIATNNLAAIQTEINTAQTQVQQMAKVTTQPSAASGAHTAPTKTKSSLTVATTSTPAIATAQTAETEKQLTHHTKITTVPAQTLQQPTKKNINQLATKTANTEIVNKETGTTPATQKVAKTAATTNSSRSPFARQRQTNIVRHNARQERFISANFAYIEAMKARQKKDMAQAFKRMNAIDAEQLQQWESNQHHKIAALRERLGQQQRIINAIIHRDREILMMRKAAIQHAQQQRQFILNHI